MICPCITHYLATCAKQNTTNGLELFPFSLVMFSFRLPECNACLCLIRAPTRNRNNEFIL